MSMIRWLGSPQAAMFYCLLIGDVHRALGEPRGAPAMAANFASMLMISSLAVWVMNDAKKRGYSLLFDYGMFLFFAWPLLVPCYLFQTRRWRAFGTLGWFLSLRLAAALGGVFLASAKEMSE